jgi:hypothetical protein
MRLNEFDPILTESLAVGDPVIITGPVRFRGRTGDVKSIGQNGAFVVVDLYNYGPQSFQASDVEYNDYADEEDVAEGNSDWSGSQGRFAGDVPVNVGGAVSKRLDVGDVVSYFGEKATILAMSKDRTVARIDLKSGITQNVKTSDLKRVGQGVAEGSGEVSVRKWAAQVRKDHGPDVKFRNRQEGGGAVDSVIATNSQGETVGVYNRKTGYPTVYEPKQGVTEVSKSTLDQYVSKAVDAHGDADFAARMSKHDPDKRSYHVDQKKTAEKRRQGISRALDRMSRPEDVAEQERVGNMPADQFDDAMARLKKLAGAGPLKTVYDPAKRVYRNVPTAVQPQTQPKK